jgi:hypothetical protein
MKMTTVRALCAILCLAGCGEAKLGSLADTGEPCARDGECMPGHLCEGGSCRKVCTSAAQCPSDEVCSVGLCMGELVCPTGCEAGCPGAAGCAFSWDVGEWSACSMACGTGTQTRTVTCVDQSGAAAADASCSGTKPTASAACTGNNCAPTYGGWSSWSGCTNGYRMRSRVCLVNGSQVSCTQCGDDCSETEACPDCAPLSSNVVNCSPSVPGDEPACTSVLLEAKARCEAAGCSWNGETACTIGGSPSTGSCFGGNGTCQ